MRREAAAWRGLPARRWSSGGTSVTMVPARGGKIVSLIDPSGREWLAQGDGRPPERPGVPFESAEMCGWDECVPTIEPSITASGRAAPDHGDAWSRGWQERGRDRFAVGLPSVDARLERGIAIDPRGEVTLDYRVSAGVTPATVLWAAHPLFRTEPSDRVVIDAPDPLWDVSASVPRRMTEAADAALNAAREPGATAKFYTDVAARPRWARIDRSDGVGLKLSWSGAAIRTLGVWIDRGRFATEDVVAFEPATGWYDSLERAHRGDTVLRLQPGESAEWSLRIRFARTDVHI